MRVRRDRKSCVHPNTEQIGAGFEAHRPYDRASRDVVTPLRLRARVDRRRVVQVEVRVPAFATGRLVGARRSARHTHDGSVVGGARVRWFAIADFSVAASSPPADAARTNLVAERRRIATLLRKFFSSRNRRECCCRVQRQSSSPAKGGRGRAGPVGPEERHHPRRSNAFRCRARRIQRDPR